MFSLRTENEDRKDVEGHHLRIPKRLGQKHKSLLRPNLGTVERAVTAHEAQLPTLLSRRLQDLEKTIRCSTATSWKRTLSLARSFGGNCVRTLRAPTRPVVIAKIVPRRHARWGLSQASRDEEGPRGALGEVGIFLTGRRRDRDTPSPKLSRRCSRALQRRSRQQSRLKVPRSES